MVLLDKPSPALEEPVEEPVNGDAANHTTGKHVKQRIENHAADETTGVSHDEESRDENATSPPTNHVTEQANHVKEQSNHVTEQKNNHAEDEPSPCNNGESEQNVSGPLDKFAGSLSDSRKEEAEQPTDNHAAAKEDSSDAHAAELPKDHVATLQPKQDPVGEPNRHDDTPPAKDDVSNCAKETDAAVAGCGGGGGNSGQIKPEFSNDNHAEAGVGVTTENRTPRLDKAEADGDANFAKELTDQHPFGTDALLNNDENDNNALGGNESKGQEDGSAER